MNGMRKVFAVLGLLLGMAGGSFAQTQALLPNGETQFADGNGAPYAGGAVYFYIPATTTPKATWKDPNGTTLNSNPVILDSAGRGIIWGSGEYRQVVQDQFGNTIWDQLTFAQGPGLLNNLAANSLLGNPTGTPGAVQAITIGSGFTLTGSNPTTLNAGGSFFKTVADSTSQGVNSAFNQQERIASAAITYTLPIGSSQSNGFGFWIYALGGNVTVTPNIADSFFGQVPGASITVVSGSVEWVSTNAQSPATWYQQVVPAQSVTSPGGRLTLVSATPVMTTNQTGISSVFYTPYTNNTVPIWTGLTFSTVTFSEVSQALSDTVLSPSAGNANNCYDYFAWITTVVQGNIPAGSFEVTRGPAWASCVSRGYNLSRVDGIWVNASGIANGPAAGFGTYLGSISTDASGATVSWSLGGSASGGVLATLNVWNCYNRVAVGANVVDSGAAYGPATTLRQARGSVTNQINFMSGLAEDTIWAGYNTSTTGPSSSASYTAGIGLNSITASTGVQSRKNSYNGTISAIETSPDPNGLIPPQLGAGYLAALEVSSAGVASLDSDSNNTLSGWFRQ
jgi:hypothetical protein